MPEHRIRLRGGWVIEEIGSPIKPSRLDLPTRWPTGSIGRVRLVRRFGRPPFHPTLEQAHLEMIEMVGLTIVRLNGHAWESPLGGFENSSIPIGDFLLARNELELVVDRESAQGREDLWGRIALVISSDQAIED